METTEISQAKENVDYYKNVHFDPMDRKTSEKLSQIAAHLASGADWRREYIGLAWENSDSEARSLDSSEKYAREMIIRYVASVDEILKKLRIRLKIT